MLHNFALTNLCELLLVELRVSNDINIIGEIKPLLEKLIGMAQHSGLYFFLIEAYILQGKLALIMFDIESSRRFSTQAQRMAESYVIIKLAEEIRDLHEEPCPSICTNSTSSGNKTSNSEKIDPKNPESKKLKTFLREHRKSKTELM